MKLKTKFRLCLAAASIVSTSLSVHAQVVVSDTLTGASSSYPWQTFGDTCLTAGDPSAISTIPACTAKNVSTTNPHVGGVKGYLPDPVGQGALRLTNGGSNDTSRTGQIISTKPFNTSQGVQVTFTTVTYGGNGFGNNYGQSSGADGLAFFLVDGRKLTSPASNMVLGAFGGSLGYSCSNNKTINNGTDGGYLAVAIDEYGNFSNPGDTTSDGPGQTPGSIVVRGAGSVYYPSLNAYNSSYYPSGLTANQQRLGVNQTCSTGFYQQWNSRNSSWQSTGIQAPDYRIITGPKTMATTIYSQEGSSSPLRTLATPITYALKITQNGILSLSYSVNGGATTSVISNQDILANNGTVPPSFLFGFTAGTGGGTNVHEITCFKAAPINIAADSAGSNAQQAAKLQVGAQIYLAYYHSLNSWGQLQALNLLTDANGNVTISSTPNWDANCVLTGCTSAPVTTAQLPSARNIVTWDPVAGTGKPFQYVNLNTTQASAIGGTGSGSDTGVNRVAYLRGDRTNEINSQGVGPYRARTGVLGDIISSSPVWVGGPNLPSNLPTTDALYNKALPGYSTYATHAAKYADRTNIVYIGANDGMLHGFRAGSPNDGSELIAFVPNAVVNSVHSSNTYLDYSSPSYAHNSYVDATPGTGNLFYNNAWHTWVVGGLGAGGNATGAINDVVTAANGVLYAIDVTDPTTFKESNASSLVIGEWSSSNIPCVNDSSCKAKLGSIYGTPIVRTMHDGNWAVVFGNGRNSANGTAGIFVMTVNKGTGAITFNYFDTKSGSTSNMNWIDYVTSADLDGDGVVDYLYAGDAYGQIWRLDVTSSDPTKWAMGKSPVFTTSSGQPITTRVLVSSALQSTGNARIILNFGTGVQYPQTLTNGNLYASGSQAVYGIWDWDMSAWNTLSSTKYASLTGPQTIGLSSLQSQTITNYSGGSGAISGYRTVTQNPVCWKGSSACASSNTQFGWQMSLPNTGEQIIYNPVIQNGGLFFNTTIPAVNQVLSCSTQPASGYTMAVAPDTGGAPVSSYFATAALNAGISPPSGGVISGIGLSGTGTPTFVTSTGKSNNSSGTGSTGSITQQTMVQQTSTGTGNATNIDQPGVSTGKRMTWVKLR
ncbi:pilus assembly protein [Undibacterium sp. SXout11W]|uniref:pilus assembly protein n=1 Tax=Undibacterium sp. SXout11W TaxID=3413050 RepID=UPI003BEF7C49